MYLLCNLFQPNKCLWDLLCRQIPLCRESIVPVIKEASPLMSFDHLSWYTTMWPVGEKRKLRKEIRILSKRFTWHCFEILEYNQSKLQYTINKKKQSKSVSKALARFILRFEVFPYYIIVKWNVNCSLSNRISFIDDNDDDKDDDDESAIVPVSCP